MVEFLGSSDNDSDIGPISESLGSQKVIIGRLRSDGHGRVAEVGKLSANAKNAFNSFVGRVFANSQQKTLFFRVLSKLQQKGCFYLVLPSFT